MEPTTVAALQTALTHYQPDALRQALRDLEHARMQAEDLRSAALTPHLRNVWSTEGRLRHLGFRYATWREYASEQRKLSATISEMIGNAADDLHAALVSPAQDVVEHIKGALMSMGDDSVSVGGDSE